MRWRLLLLPLLLAAACGPSEPSATDGGTTDAGTDGGADAGSEDGGSDGGLDGGGTDGGSLVEDRPYGLTVPDAYDGSAALPLVFLLHGFTADAVTQDLYFGMSALARQRGFFVALPDGTFNATLQRFWNATDACCGFGSDVDDVAYLEAVLDDIESQYLIDPKRVFFVGHSNGGFMSHRMACERPGRVAAIASLAGAVWKDESLCDPAEPVSVLQIHGTLDAVILYGGGWNMGFEYPGAVETVDTWATLNGCDATTTALTPDLDLVNDLLGAETTRIVHEGCPATGAAELWRIEAGSHLPTFRSDWAGVIYDWLMAHPRP
ncbi:MAG: alpha/beta fold hydrolase [Deltaproteobacteria bacterium]|nr:alpha/beta fold hydrolase [Deltaproteobacteria bacterium]